MAVDKILVIFSNSQEVLDAIIKNRKDLDYLKSLKSEILNLYEKIENKISYVNSLEPIDEIISKGTDLKDYNKYKNLEDVKKIVSQLQDEKQKRQKLIGDLNSITKKLNSKEYDLKIVIYDIEKQNLSQRKSTFKK